MCRNLHFPGGSPSLRGKDSSVRQTTVPIHNDSCAVWLKRMTAQYRGLNSKCMWGQTYSWRRALVYMYGEGIQLGRMNIDDFLHAVLTQKMWVRKCLYLGAINVRTWFKHQIQPTQVASKTETRIKRSSIKKKSLRAIYCLNNQSHRTRLGNKISCQLSCPLCLQATQRTARLKVHFFYCIWGRWLIPSLPNVPFRLYVDGCDTNITAADLYGPFQRMYEVLPVLSVCNHSLLLKPLTFSSISLPGIMPPGFWNFVKSFDL